MTKSFKPKQIQRIFIANRGEIASRIVKTARKMGITTIGLTTQMDNWCDADEKSFLQGHTLAETYLNIDAIIELASAFKADAIHPGYGFLSENHTFAKAVEDAGMIFIGPSHQAIHQMGNKLNARGIAQRLKIPITPSISGSANEVLENISKLNFPIVVKAAAGGGGKGMYKVNQPEKLPEIIARASREAVSYFGNETVYAEQYLEEPRHIEVQILGDQHHNYIHLFERECSIQRRYQKIIEEAPSTFLTEELRKTLTNDAIKLCKEIGYYNAGTIEFLVDNKGNHYFLEMNTRIQVEHPVTEEITGVDIVEQQIRIAEGLPLQIKQDDISFNGHAIECRIYAEDAGNNFSPAPGQLYEVNWPKQELARTDTWIEKPVEIKPDFDPMMAKIITHGKNREEAIRKNIAALNNTAVLGITNNIHYLSEVLKSEAFIKGETTTGFCNNFFYTKPQSPDEKAIAAAALLHILRPNQTKNQSTWQKIGYFRLQQNISFSINQQLYQIQWQDVDDILKIEVNGQSSIEIRDINDDHKKISFFSDKKQLQFNSTELPDGSFILRYEASQLHVIPSWILPNKQDCARKKSTNLNFGNTLTAPIPGKITDIKVAEGDMIRAGDTLAILEAMKMENLLKATHDGVIEKIRTLPGTQVKANEVIMELKL
ncbi:acetyl/propionyl/methylcrotonyl-CoA carboxylase subunit alpha [Natronoflexus pectinivorans]|uniref:Propionyl-CoA carboxylase alpha chain/3-methylcrotonyl-CoA carboxylase alpha subunit n=1 Tax=Natronoflexus pectinivorans TaxID=682526 RepID=A0A4R2GEE2_9BACT|nr:biotin carboxylase N-terminal domain-containing protein [Natronoflexus pectinivorans]TCO06112.1 propionyl-CoA carboxylase alpha chain/3-methylcrotonyl-CoA carboxylase alpha subunit [Natronoflexus pectinivorans]